jgi:hypothetical protein
MLRASTSTTPRSGMAEPGLTPCGSTMKRTAFSGVFGKRPAM